MRGGTRGWPATAAILALATLAGVTAGCGRGAVLDRAGVEAAVGAHLTATFDVAVDRVGCPADEPVDEGRAFSCTAVVADQEVGVRAVQRDGRGTLAVEPAAALLVTERIVADVARALGERFDRPGVEVSCPGPPVRVEAPGAVIGCTASDGDDDVVVDVQVRNTAGALAYAVRDAEG